MSNQSNPKDFVTPDMSDIDEARVDALMRGAVDLHVHSGPSVMPRQLDHLAALEEASAAGMRAIVFKDHYYPSSVAAEMFNERFPDMVAEALGSVVLNNAVGGFNPYAVEPALRMGAKIVWMPTISAANHIRAGHRKNLLPTKVPMLKQAGLSPVNALGEVVDSVKQVLDLVAQHDATLSAGHLHISEIWPLFEEARRRGVTRLLVNHPTFTIEASYADMRELAEAGVFLEHSACMFIENRMRSIGADTLAELIEAGTIEQTFFGSDLGQINAPRPVEGMRMTIRLLLAMGYSDEEVRAMVSGNAARLVGLGHEAPALARSA